MGSYDREYTERRAFRPPGLPPVVKALLIANVAVFVLDIFFLDHLLFRLGCFTIWSAIHEGAVWEFLTFQFLHGGLGHLLANCLGLYVFGPLMERWWGSARFLVFYLLCGAAGAGFYTLLGFPPLVPLVGASAGIFGIMAGVALTAPDLRVRLLFPPIEMSMRTMAWLALGFAAVAVLTGLGGNAGGEAGHLGGAILGFILVKFPFLLGKGDRSVLAPSWQRRARGEPKLRPRTTIDLETSSEVDRILDKIQREGIHTLTQEEKDILNEASRRP